MESRKARLSLALALASAFSALMLGLSAVFIPVNEGISLRREASGATMLASEDARLAQISQSGVGAGRLSIRRAVASNASDETILLVAESLLQGSLRIAALLELAGQGRNLQSLLSDAPIKSHSRLSRMPGIVDALSSYRIFGASSADYAASSISKRSFWALQKRDSQDKPRSEASLYADAREIPLGTEIFPLPSRAGLYRELIESFAKRYNLSIELVYAIIHSESDFSPTLVSSKSAMGLMQLLPSTASDEVHRFLYGRRGEISFEQLRVPEINIRYGTAYLHILLTRYFQDVRDPLAREYCAIAAYNMGPNRFLRLYGSNNDAAVETINAMSADELYADLTNRLPVRETRYYVAKVRRMKQHYAALRQQGV